MKREEMVRVIASSLMLRLGEWEKKYRLEFADEILGEIEIEIGENFDFVLDWEDENE